MPSLYLISIEPMFSQSVGDYEYLCDSIEKVEHFRKIFRIWAQNIKVDASKDSGNWVEEDQEEGASGWEFFENIFVVTSLDQNFEIQLLTLHHIFRKHYYDFCWLDEPKIKVNYYPDLSTMKESSFKILPSVNHIKDNVSGDSESITMSDFLKQNDIKYDKYDLLTLDHRIEDLKLNETKYETIPK